MRQVTQAPASGRCGNQRDRGDYCWLAACVTVSIVWDSKMQRPGLAGEASLGLGNTEEAASGVVCPSHARRRFAAALLPRLFGTTSQVTPQGRHTGRVRTDDQFYTCRHEESRLCQNCPGWLETTKLPGIVWTNAAGEGELLFCEFLCSEFNTCVENLQLYSAEDWSPYHSCF